MKDHRGLALETGYLHVVSAFGKVVVDFENSYRSTTSVSISTMLRFRFHGGVDEVGALVVLIKTSLRVGSFSFVDTEGTRQDFKIHDAWRRTSKNLKGKTLDQRSAYKQLAVSARDLMYSVTIVFNPSIFVLSSGYALAYPLVQPQTCMPSMPVAGR